MVTGGFTLIILDTWGLITFSFFAFVSVFHTIDSFLKASLCLVCRNSIYHWTWFRRRLIKLLVRSLNRVEFDESSKGNSVQPRHNLGFVVIPEEMGLCYTSLTNFYSLLTALIPLFLYYHAGDDAELFVYKKINSEIRT